MVIYEVNRCRRASIAAWLDATGNAQQPSSHTSPLACSIMSRGRPDADKASELRGRGSPWSPGSPVELNEDEHDPIDYLNLVKNICWTLYTLYISLDP